MDYLYTAHFSDESVFAQPADDKSTLKEGQTSKHDFLEHAKGRQLTAIYLRGLDHTLSVYSDGVRSVDGVRVATGDPLPEGVEWVEGDSAQGAYFRRVTKTFSEGLELQHTDVQYCVGMDAKPGVKNYLGVR